MTEIEKIKTSMELKFNNWLEQAQKERIISSLDKHLADFFKEYIVHDSPKQFIQFQFLIIWLNMSLRAGHVCISISKLTKEHLSLRIPEPYLSELLQLIMEPSHQDWINLIQKNTSELVSNGTHFLPFVLSKEGKFYFQRIWQNENNVACFFQHRFKNECLKKGKTRSKEIKHIIEQLFQEQAISNEIDWQKIAVIKSLLNSVTIISGGPGTGKTTTVSKILAAQLMDSTKKDLANQMLHNIIAAAPTGKAAARLTESLTKATQSLNVESSIKAQLNITAATLHRLLGARPNSQHYYYNKKNKLNVDILLIDEASMIDLALMSRLIDALPDSAKLILLGDKEQLSSVEAGSVFGDVCQLSEIGISSFQATIIEQITGDDLSAFVNENGSEMSLSDSIALLQKSYRFDSKSGIGRFAEWVKMGNASEAISLLISYAYDDIKFNRYPTWQNRYFDILNQTEYQEIIQQLVDGYDSYLQSIKKRLPVETIIERFNDFKVLSALRDSPFGVKELNQQIRMNIMSGNNDKEWYEGRPVMVTQNHSALGLFNGDIGITLLKEEELRVYFSSSTGELINFSPYILPEVETCYAMTIHKSQGSEFDQVAIILPAKSNGILNKSLLYTAVTRAKKQAVVFSSLSILTSCIENSVDKESGLYQQLISVDTI